MVKARSRTYSPLARAMLMTALYMLASMPCALAEDAPVPQKKPASEAEAQTETETPEQDLSVKVGPNLILEAIMQLGGRTPKEQETEAVELPADADPQTPSQEAQAEEILNVTFAPIPPRKPAYIPPQRSTIERLMLEAQGKTYDKPMKAGQAELYQQIFEAQREGDMKKANSLIEDLTDTRLLGHVLFQRYMHPSAYTSTFAELQQWMDVYADHPAAHRIYRLAEARKPTSLAHTVKQPEVSKGIVRTFEPASRARKRYVSAKRRTNDEVSQLNSVNRQVYSALRKGRLKEARSIIDKHVNLLDNVEYDLLRAEIASSYLHRGDAQTAFSLAKASVKRSGLHVPKAGWVAGLIAWRQQKYMDAARYFEVTARSPYASGWTLTAGAYWAARSHMRTGNVKMVSTWLKRGSKQPRTFYGLVATRALGRDFDFNWKIPAFTKKYLNVLNAIPAGQRAIALVMAGQVDLAEAELIRVKPENDDQRIALLAYANYANLPGLALRLATDASGASEDIYDAALYPMGNWRLNEGNVDPALVHAIMRQESRFDPNAESPSGAKGLMQLMPATAKSVAVTGEERLDHAETNLELGRRYIENLLDTDVVGGNLVYLLVAYNAGPGNLAKWKRRWPDVKDPLLFIELIPASETRAYVERVLSNYWIYRLREGADTPTLDAITAGKAPLYGFQNNAEPL